MIGAGKSDAVHGDEGGRLDARCRTLEQRLASTEQERNALRDSLHEYRLLFRAAGNAMAVIEPDGTLSLVNQEFERLFGFERAAIEGQKRWNEFVAPRDLSRMKTMRERRLRGEPGIPTDYDATLIARDGSEILGRISIVMIPGTKRSICSISDITYRRHIEAQLAESERNYRTMFEESPVAIALLGPRGEVLNVNGRLHDWLGFSRDEFIGKNMLLLPCFPWRTKLRIMRKFTQRMMGKDLPPYDVVFLGRDGKQYYGRVQAAPIRNEQGRPIADLVMISNVTAQKRTERALQESEQKLIKAQEIAHLGYWEYDLEHDHVILSPELYRIFGLDADNTALTYATLRNCIHPDDREYHDAIMEHVKKEGKANFEYRVKRPDGTIRYVSGKGEASFGANGEPVRLFGILQDVSVRHKAEEERLQLEANLLQAQKFESLGVLAGGIAHDFNNLLMAIMGNAELARTELPPDSSLHKGLIEINTIARDAADLCRQMLAYSGQGQFYVHPLNVTEIIESMAHLLNVSIEKSVVLESDLDPNVPAIEADASQIRQLVMNLISNASEAIGKESGMISLKTGSRHASRSYLRSIALEQNLPEGEYVFIEVSDNGDGIPEDVQQRMFDPFFSTRFTGRGLGLAAVLGIVRSHDGAIHVESAPGKGTRVTVLFPKTTAIALPADPEPAPSDRPIASPQNQTVLVVDDEQPVLNVTGRILTKAGYRILTATDGAQAIARVKEHRDEINAIILDMAMPNMSGTEALDRIHEILPTVPVIIASGFSEEEVQSEFKHHHVSAILQKPYSADVLLRQLTQSIK
jgi:two-component system cell cycle sensor histidine kinase/response regulator CckA